MSITVFNSGEPEFSFTEILKKYGLFQINYLSTYLSTSQNKGLTLELVVTNEPQYRDTLSWVSTHVCVCRKDAYLEALNFWLVFETQIVEMVKETIQSLKLENDKLKDKIQEIFAELHNLRDEVKAERNGRNANGI